MGRIVNHLLTDTHQNLTLNINVGDIFHVQTQPLYDRQTFARRSCFFVFSKESIFGPHPADRGGRKFEEADPLKQLSEHHGLRGRGAVPRGPRPGEIWQGGVPYGIRMFWGANYGLW